jgi:hypothetical protein
MTTIKDIQLVKKFKADIISNGEPIKVLQYESKDGVSVDDIRKQLKILQENNPKFNNDNYSLSVDVDFREAGWRSGEFQKFNTDYEDFELFNIFDYYDESDSIVKAFLDRVNIDNFDDYKYNKFNVYVKYDGDNTGGSDDKNNNCLFKCLLKSCSKKTNHFFSKPSQLKFILGLKDDDKIPVEKINIIEKYMYISIRVEGDYIYEPTTIRPIHINLILKNGHYTLKNDKIHNQITKLIHNTKHSNSLIVCNFKEYYDGNDIQNYEGDIKKISGYSNTYIYKTTKNNLEEEYSKVLNDIKSLKQETDINLLEYGNIPTASLKSFYDLCLKNNYGASPDELTQLESDWIQKATNGGIMYCIKNRTCDKAYCYDINSLYPHTLLNMSFPASQGVFMNLATLPEKIDYLFIAKVKVEKGHQLFRYNRFNLYTSYDLQNAKRLKLSMDLINDEINCLSYKDARIIDGEHFFKPFINYWYEKKTNGVPFAKLILNSLWGALCQTNKLKYPINKDNKLYCPDGYKLTKMTQGLNKTGYEYEFKNILTQFKYPYARLKPFLLSKSKSHILTNSINYHLKNGTILYSHTDSLITNKPLTFKLSTEMGKWKLERQGKIIIKNISDKKWVEI